MKIRAFDEDKKVISVDKFFSKYNDFSDDYKLSEQTARCLKVLTRHHRHPEVIADVVDSGYALTVSGENRTYTILFEVEHDAIVLKEVK